MSDSKSPQGLLIACLGLNVITLGAVGWLAFRSPAEPEEAESSSTLEDLADEISDARIEMRRSTERLEALVTRLGEGASPPPADPSSGAAATRPLPELGNDELFSRWLHVCDVLSRCQHNPLEREPVEEERGRVEAEMRGRTDGMIDTIAARFRTVEDHWLRTRLLTHLVEPIASDRAYDFAVSVFEDPSFLPGVRLYAAQVAMKRPADRDRVIGELIELLRHPDPSFNRPDDIVNFLKTSPDARALPILIDLAKDERTEQNLRAYAIAALGSYHAPECVTALQELAQLVTLGNLRMEAVRSLHKIQGKDVLEFARSLREKIGAEDQNLRTFLDNLEAKYQNG